ncbi:3-hydroxyisobutyrate dehydrogenase-like protein [Leptotrombidium deliense]|uniref:3-hydroxyisobutyrate dehydrogenase n=1 Tax=Leptotrombidium deliense TaxID=299467 RepID=A0A443SP42_9ACAR|nr:3-hydroxyisobutyrate dehydrogenase-like protein [Leptotrombidium deliense]
MSSQRSVGFVGLGNMGSSMSSHLLKKGNKVVVYDVNPNAMAALAKEGAETASSPADLAGRCQYVMTMVPTGKEVMHVYAGKDGILSNVKPGTYLMDSSTIDPNTSREVHKLATEKGAIFMDTPVSGAVPAAKAATLTFMCGGKASDVEKIKDVLLCMGKNVVHTGDIGTGSIAKICNNMQLAISMIGTSEALNLAQNMGLDPKLMTQILNISSGRTWVSEIYHPVPGIMENVPASNEYKNGFLTQLITKDLGLAQSIAHQSQSPIPLGSTAHMVYRMMLNNGYFNKDFSVVYQFLKDKDNKKN